MSLDICNSRVGLMIQLVRLRQVYLFDIWDVISAGYPTTPRENYPLCIEFWVALEIV